MTQRIGLTTCGIEEIDGRIAESFPEEFTAGVHVSVLHAVDRLAGNKLGRGASNYSLPLQNIIVY